MKSLEINGNLREATGKKDSKKLRDQELIPCVLYGGEKNIHFYASVPEFRPLIYTPDVYVVNLNIDGKVYPSILQDAQWHPVEEQMLHADFLQIEENKPVKVELPVTIEGTAKGIKVGGKMKVNVRKLKVKGLVKNLPDTIVVNVTELDLGQSFKVGDLNLEGVQILAAKSNVIATINITRAAKAAQTGKEGKK
ncbi:MAG TPA: 50S ribosomal protein L25/general stress protein Ctc [Prolixibacteraceae bacterium]|nr:50S ribosomal protein L25/general stress protein Ctc [Prolixibacteraceae bacterium]